MPIKKYSPLSSSSTLKMKINSHMFLTWYRNFLIQKKWIQLGFKTAPVPISESVIHCLSLVAVCDTCFSLIDLEMSQVMTFSPTLPLTWDIWFFVWVVLHFGISELFRHLSSDIRTSPAYEVYIYFSTVRDSWANS